jgi:hypothetical protein
MTNLWMAIPWIVAAAVLIVIAPVVTGAYLRYRGSRTVRCPRTGTDATIEVDAGHAARTAFPGPPDVRVQTCSHWPDLEGCDEACIRSRAAAEAHLN